MPSYAGKLGHQNGYGCTQDCLCLALQVPVLPVLVQKLNAHLCLPGILPAADIVSAASLRSSSVKSCVKLLPLCMQGSAHWPNLCIRMPSLPAASCCNVCFTARAKRTHMMLQLQHCTHSAPAYRVQVCKLARHRPPEMQLNLSVYMLLEFGSKQHTCLTMATVPVIS